MFNNSHFINMKKDACKMEPETNGDPKPDSLNELLSPHFSLLEFTESTTARKYGISNVPPPEAVINLRALCMGTLEPLREALQSPVIISSGYRTKALNDLLAHSSNRSQHMTGQAADFYVGWNQKLRALSARELLVCAFRLILTNEQIDYDQLILYPTFIHVSYVSPKANRHSILLGKSDGKLRDGRVSLQKALTIQ